MIADNDLDFYAVSNINQMEEFISDYPNIGSLYVYIDRAKNRKPAHPVLYKISADITPKINSKILRVYPETDSSNEIVFKSVLDEIVNISSSNNEQLKGLILWSHGSAWLPESVSLSSNRTADVKSFGLDLSPRNDINSHSEMDIKKLAQSLTNYHFDFLLFDACFMSSIEVFYELKDVSDYIIASPTEVLASGFPYKLILEELFDNHVNYKNVCQKYVDFFRKKKGVLQSAYVSVIKTSELNLFITYLNQTIKNYNKPIYISNILQYDQNKSGYLFDLGQFLSILEDEKTLSQFKKVCLFYNHTDYFFNHINLQSSSGISIFIPNDLNNKKNEYEFYKTLSWYKDTRFPVINIY